jgi:hypothetical protein
MLLICLTYELVCKSRVHLEGMHWLLDVSHADCCMLVCFLSQRFNLATIELPKFRVCGFLRAKLGKQNKIFCLKTLKNADYLADQALLGR